MILDFVIILLGFVAGVFIIIYNSFTTKKEFIEENTKQQKKKVEFINDEFVLINEETIEQVQTNFREKVQYYDNEIPLLDSNIVEQQIENFRERISNDYSSIEIIDEFTIQKIIENIRNQIQYKEFQSLSNLGDELNKTVQKMLDTYINEFNKEQKQFNTKLIFIFNLLNAN